jgi:N-acetylglucosaminyl-diphospho-decaprenol L-rhamnosyltransferase
MLPEVEVSVILATRNSWTFLAPCIRSIYKACGLPFEIIVVDNASTDRTRENLATQFPDVRVTALTGNRGHTYAVNIGMKTAVGAFFMILDADTVLEPHAVDRLVHFLKTNSGCAIVAPRMLDPDGSTQQTARNFPSPMNGVLGRQSLLTRLLPSNPVSQRYLRSRDAKRTLAYEVDWVSAACMVFPRRVVDSVGLWDEGFSGYWVDADWCKRAQSSGSIACEPSARVIHYEQNRRGVKRGKYRILSFHTGANRFYRKHSTLGYFDPRALVCAAALSIRALLQLMMDPFLADPLRAINPPAPSHLRPVEVDATETQQ